MIGRLVDQRYEVISRIARGGMATVYLATDLRLERQVAIKVMHGHLADDSQFTLRFVQEAKSAARLAHPNVVNVFDQGQDGESAYLVMEYLEGITLRDLLHEYGTLTSEQTLDITEAILSGLTAAHAAGMVHRDLKPENVLLADDGRIKIGDFGLARAVTAKTATGAALLGTIAYLSPELVTRGIADTRSDIYAVGIMMYEMLAGEQPFKGDQPMQIAFQHANDSVPTPSTKNPMVPAELDELVLWATARDPEQRPHDAKAMLEQLRQTEELLQTALPTGSTPVVQRTALLPVLEPGDTAETNVLEPLDDAAARRPQGSIVELHRAALRRRTRGRWLAAVVVLLTILSGTAGWWFGLGPGGMLSIPASIEGVAEPDARAALTELGFVVAAEPRSEHSILVPEGAVVGTVPAVGSSVPRAEPIELIVSLGPRAVEVPVLAGTPETDAVAALGELGIDVADIDRVFNDERDDGVVIAASGDDGTDFGNGGDSFEGREIDLVVSLGSVPPVSGLSETGARAALESVGLRVEIAEQRQYDSNVARGDVLWRAGGDDVLREGDTVTIVLSDGPEPIEVPELVGLTVNQAIELLEGAGLPWEVDTILPSGPFWSVNRVESTTHSPGTLVEPGTTITLHGEL